MNTPFPAETPTLLHLLKRLEALEAAQQRSSQTRLDGLIVMDQEDYMEQQSSCKQLPTPEAAPVASDEELLNIWYKFEKYEESLRAVYDLGRQHGAAQPVPSTEFAALSDALIRAECALSDIAEGEETNAALNTFKWAEQRCAETLATIRPVMQQHGVRTSEWPPVPPTPEAAPVATDNGLLRCYAEAVEDAVKRGASHDEAKEAGRRACYDLGRQPVAAQLLRLKKELERERLRLAACGAVAMADTPESAAKAREIDPKFDDVIRQVDALMEASADLPDFSSAADNQVIVSCPETCWVQIRRIADGKVIYDNHRRGTLTIPVGEPPAAQPAPAGGLVERVTKAIHPSICADPNLYRHEARAAIREVAEWLDQRGMHGCSLWLREEVAR